MTPSIEQLPIVRVCAACELQSGLSALPRPFISHGFCRRHFKAALQHAGCTELEIEAALNEFTEESFCADLGGPTITGETPVPLAEARA